MRRGSALDVRHTPRYENICHHNQNSGGILWVSIASFRIGSDIMGRHSSDYRWVFLELVLLLVLAFLAVAPNRWFVVSRKNIRHLAVLCLISVLRRGGL